MCSSMAGEADTYAKPQKLASDPMQENQSKFHSNFLYKAAIVTLFLIVLPLFPSQAPDFINQNLITRSWELIHLLFVGIAISYGLFSRKNDDAEKENGNSKLDNAQSYVSRLLQVSSVFDDEPENPSVSDDNKVQTWSSQYYRNEPPMVVVAKESSVTNENGGNSNGSRTGERPLLLPVRSLRSRIPESATEDGAIENAVVSGSGVTRPNSKTASKRFSSNSNKEFGELDHDELEEKLKESVVLPSPIPWRSRSGRLEMKEEVNSSSHHASMGEHEFSRVESRVPRTQPSRLTRPSSFSSSPSLSSPNNSSESQPKISEDRVKKKTSYDKSYPPPPPPPPSFSYKSSSFKPSFTFSNDGTRSRFDSLSMGRSVSTDRAEDNASQESDQEETESEDEEIGGRFGPNDVVESPRQSPEKNEETTSSNGVGDGGPDVDKKADEFIAKFREQIRLQRIASIKRSSAQMSKKLSR
ncbi:uncharacterized protein LOC133778117 [Humulus lupulus]|uniref:uncharacterized protein LOC133778117 n=1 Tax=Humulus lupulus TaxID=3486 RepID=UPI002B400E72|nr:uncharacterized protein LOC133778117 [Humulus lupulus]